MLETVNSNVTEQKMKNNFILLLAILLCQGPSYGQIPNMAEEITTHLEFLGFEVTLEEGKMVTTHTTRLDMTIQQWEGGLLFTNFGNPTPYALKNLKNLMRFINKLNSKAGAGRYYLNEHNQIIIEAYYPGDYNKKSFSTFLDIWEKELTNLSNIMNEMPNYLE